jgi:TPR repeat protein
MKRNINWFCLILLCLFGSRFASAQTEEELYQIMLSDNNLRIFLASEKDSFCLWTDDAVERQIARSVQIELVNSTNSGLIESSFINNVRTIKVSNSFLKMIGKIVDAFYIQATIATDKKVEAYIEHCVNNLNTVPKDPATFFNLNNQQLVLYRTPYHYNAREALFRLAVRFILAHELTHQLYHFDNEDGLSKIEQEIDADEIALYYFRDEGWLPIVMVPVMLYFQELEKKNTDDHLVFSHPTGLERISALLNSSLTNFPKTYQTMSSRGPVGMSYEKMYDMLLDIYLDINSQLLLEMDQDFDTYYQRAENGNVAAQIKMGVMHFKGTNGWDKNDAEGFRWLTIAAKHSEYGGLLLGMFYEINGDLDMAIATYQENSLKGSYLSGELITYLYNWKAKNRTGFKESMQDYALVYDQKCMDSCKNEFGNTTEQCELFYCNYSVKYLYACLNRFRGIYK